MLENNSTKFYLKYTNDKSENADVALDSEGLIYIPKHKLIKSSNNSIRGGKNKRQVTSKVSSIFL